jgi:hypothetical protein
LHSKKLDLAFLPVANARLHADAAPISTKVGKNVWERFNADACPATLSLEHECVRECDAVIGTNVDKNAVLLPMKMFIYDLILANLAHAGF